MRPRRAWPRALVGALVGVLVGAAACTGGGQAEAGGETDEETGPIFDPPPPECGNGYLEEGEQCDDANLDEGDGCDGQCRIPCGLLWEATVPSTDAEAEPQVVDMAVGPGGEIVVAGTLDALSSELDDDLWIGAFDEAGAPLWSSVLDPQQDLDQVAAGVAVAPDGSVYLAATLDLGPEQADATDIWVARLDASGTEQWSASFSGPVEGSKDAAGGIALTPAGNPLVSGHQRVADKDGDVWVAELAADDGAQLWSTTWSGTIADNGYSLDRGGPVEVAADGTIWTLAVEYVDYQTFDAHLLAFDPSGVPLGDWAPHVDESPGHEHVPAGLSVDAAGRVYFGVARLGPGATFWLHALVEGELAWVREMDGFVDEGEDWTLGGVAAAPASGSAPEGGVFCGGTLLRDEKEDAWREGWMHRLDLLGGAICEVRYVPAGVSLLRPNLFVHSIAAAGDGELLIAAGRVADIEDQRSFWVGAFRGP